MKQTSKSGADASSPMNFVLTIAVVLLAVAVPLGVLISAQVRGESSSKHASAFSKNKVGAGQDTGMQAGDYRISGPFTHKNLTIFLIHGKNMMEGRSFLTLQEALEQKKAVVLRDEVGKRTIHRESLGSGCLRPGRGHCEGRAARPRVGR